MAGVAGMSGLMVELADRYVLTSNREERKAGCAYTGGFRRNTSESTVLHSGGRKP